MSELKNTVILYHAGCTDGFASAFSAYLKFGDQASYIPVRYQVNVPEGLEGKDVYIVDFSYDKPVLDAIAAKAKSLTILDHHISAKEAIESMPNHRYALDHSGAYLSWEFFHPGTEVPLLIRYIEDGDLFKHELPDARNVLTYIYVRDGNFDGWKMLLEDFKDPDKVKRIAEQGRAYSEYRDHLVDRILLSAQEVEFEGNRVFAVNGVHELRNELGNQLAQRSGLFGIVWYQQFGAIDVSLRGLGRNGDIDLSKIATKYGGGGHYGAAGFKVRATAPLPWKPVDDSA